MSQDLFAAFGGETSSSHEHDPTLATGTIQEITEGGKDGLQASSGQLGILTSDAFEDDDDFGDFEDASLPTQHEARSKQQPDIAGHDYVNRPKAAVTIRKQTSLPFQSRTLSTVETKPSRNEPKKPKSSGRHPFAGSMDVLFDAGDDEYDAGTDELGDLSSNPEAAVAYSKRIIAEQEAARAKKSIREVPPTTVKTTSTSTSGPKKLRKKSGYAPPARTAEVLFDVEDVGEREDDGQVEEASGVSSKVDSRTTVQPASSKEAASVPAMDLLNLEESTDAAWASISTESNVRTRPEPQRSLSKGRQSTTVDVNPSITDFDDWDDFETAAPNMNAGIDDNPWGDVNAPASDTHPSTSSIVPPVPATKRTAQEDERPPLNVPPPIILLSVFPSIFSSANDALFETLAKLDLKQRQALLAHPATHQFLKGYIGHCTVLAHIIAGRKLRWKRDQHLSQSMRIGPSAAGGKGGMKLAGLDKSEAAKEDREVLDVVTIWKGQVGKLRSAVTAASTAPGLPKLPPLPDIAEQMPVRSLKQIEGGLTAPHPCGLCGLKREERVAKVDLKVQDSFGEWWLQSMNMHVACKNFWEEFEKKLKSR